jgi:hypothetical protein
MLLRSLLRSALDSREERVQNGLRPQMQPRQQQQQETNMWVLEHSAMPISTENGRRDPERAMHTGTAVAAKTRLLT